MYLFSLYMCFRILLHEQNVRFRENNPEAVIADLKNKEKSKEDRSLDASCGSEQYNVILIVIVLWHVDATTIIRCVFPKNIMRIHGILKKSKQKYPIAIFL